MFLFHLNRNLISLSFYSTANSFDSNNDEITVAIFFPTSTRIIMIKTTTTSIYNLDFLLLSNRRNSILFLTGGFVKEMQIVSIRINSYFKRLDCKRKWEIKSRTHIRSFIRTDTTIEQAHSPNQDTCCGVLRDETALVRTVMSTIMTNLGRRREKPRKRCWTFSSNNTFSMFQCVFLLIDVHNV
jgi:hypothetical protein